MFAKFIKYFLLAVVIVIVGWMFATGRFSAKDAEQLGRRAYYGTKGAVSQIAESPRADLQGGAAQCRENLRQIESAKRKAASLKGQTSGVVSVQEVESALKGPIPTCPAGGQYSIGGLVQMPTCSISSQGNLDESDDHVLRQF